MRSCGASDHPEAVWTLVQQNCCGGVSWWSWLKHCLMEFYWTEASRLVHRVNLFSISWGSSVPVDCRNKTQCTKHKSVTVILCSSGLYMMHQWSVCVSAEVKRVENISPGGSFTVMCRCCCCLYCLCVSQSTSDLRSGSPLSFRSSSIWP